MSIPNSVSLHLCGHCGVPQLTSGGAATVKWIPGAQWHPRQPEGPCCGARWSSHHAAAIVALWSGTTAWLRGVQEFRVRTKHHRTSLLRILVNPGNTRQTPARTPLRRSQFLARPLKPRRRYRTLQLCVGTAQETRQRPQLQKMRIPASATHVLSECPRYSALRE